MLNTAAIKTALNNFNWILFFAAALFTVGIWYIGYTYINYEKRYNEELYLQRQTERQQISWNSVSEMDKSSIKDYFEMYIQKPEVSRLVDISNNGSKTQQDTARKELYDLLLPVYEKLKSKNIEQLHFQNRDNDSFLRFHLPSAYGDSLNATRPAIVSVNKNKREVFGFETGKVAQSFRGVFPITHNGTHVGSVDMGRPFEALKHKLETINLGTSYFFAVKSSETIKKLFDKEKLTRSHTIFKNEWLIENDVNENKNNIIRKIINALSSDNDNFDKLISSGAFSKRLILDKTFYVITVVPVLDTTDKYSSVLISFVDAPQLMTLEQNYKNNLIYFSLVLGVLFLALFLAISAGQKIQASKKRFATVAKTMGEGLFMLNIDGEIDFINKSAADTLGYTEEECLGKVAHNLFHSHSKNGNISLDECNINKATANNQTYYGIEHFIKKDGTIFAADVISSPVELGGALVGSVAVFRDITERLRLEENLKTLNTKLEQMVKDELEKRIGSERMFGVVFDKNPDGMTIIDENGYILESNASAAQLLGYAKSDFIGKNLIEMSPNVQHEFGLFSENTAKLFLGETLSGATKYFEWTHVSKDGEYKIVEVMLTPISWRNQNKILCTWRDITELKKLQNEKEATRALLIQQNKLAEMGAMIATIAHQWKQPLNALWIMIQDVESAYRFGDFTEEYFGEFKSKAKDQISFMNQTIEDFRNFYKPSASTTVFSVANAVNTIVSIIGSQLRKENIELSIKTDETVRIYGLENEFKQVILSLINNAKDALISKNIEHKKIEITTTQDDGNIIIEILDNAGGIDETLLKSGKLFEPYFSTKGESGTGIGLSLSKTIIEKKMNGKLSASNKLDGASFSIQLRRYDAQ